MNKLRQTGTELQETDCKNRHRQEQKDRNTQRNRQTLKQIDRYIGTDRLRSTQGQTDIGTYRRQHTDIHKLGNDIHVQKHIYMN